MTRSASYLGDSRWNYIGRWWRAQIARLRFLPYCANVQKIEGFLVPGQEEWLLSTAKSLPDGSRIVEIGAYKGRATVSLGLGCLGTRKHVFSIDTFKGVYRDVGDSPLREIFEAGFLDEWRKNVELNGLTDYVTPLVGNSRDIASIWAAPIHLLFIDGSHDYEDVVADFDNFFPWVVQGGLVAVHDVAETWPGPLRAWREIIRPRLINLGAVSSLAFGTKSSR